MNRVLRIAVTGLLLVSLAHASNALGEEKAADIPSEPVGQEPASPTPPVDIPKSEESADGPAEQPEEKSSRSDNLIDRSGGELLGGVGLATRYGTLFDRRTTEYGIRGFLSFHQWAIGVAGYRTGSERRAPEPYRDFHMEVDTRALYVEYLFHPDRIVHFNLSLAGGNGAISYRDANDNDNRIEVKSDFYTFYEPEFAVEMNFASYIRAWIGVAHQFVQGVGIAGLKDDDIERTLVQIGVKIGQF